ncbi:MAG TPA: CHAD domain-containing protein [Streptosporangiaceae bacterium]|nr:CHAD domain-containing protein [Streptosporangiaceae bacterium]
MQNGSREFVLEGAGATPDLLDSVAQGTGHAFTCGEEGPVRRVRRTWLDTFDWRLYRAGLALEQQAGRAGTELVLTGRDGERLASLPVSSGNGRAVGWPSLVTALPAGPLRELLEPVAGVRALAPVARAVSEVRERRVLNSDQKTVARLSVDSMTVSYPARAQAPPRLAVCAVRGYQAQVGRLSASLAACCGAQASDRSALEAVLAAAGHQPAARQAEPELTAGMPAALAIAAILTVQLDAVEGNLRGTIRDVDTEFLHDLRVAVRRTRSVLKLGGQVLPDRLADAYRPEFRWLGDLTTPGRDLDVYLLGFAAMAGGLIGAEPEDLLPFRDYLIQARAAAYRDLSRGLRSARFTRLASGWRAALAQVRPGRRQPAAAQFAGARIAVAQRRAVRAGLRITAASPASDLHDLRKRCKELRYLLEMFGPLYDPAQRWQAIRELKALQDCLGEFQDAEVQHAEIRAFATQMVAQHSAPAQTLLAMGEIAAGLALRQRRARSEFDGRFAAFARPASQQRLTALTQVSGA